MAEAVMETICTHCKNRDICKYCEDVCRMYEDMHKANIVVPSPLEVKVICGRYTPTNEAITYRQDLTINPAPWIYPTKYTEVTCNNDCQETN